MVWGCQFCLSLGHTDGLGLPVLPVPRAYEWSGAACSASP